MGKYAEKATVVETMRYEGTKSTMLQLAVWLWGSVGASKERLLSSLDSAIENMGASPGDYIIKERDGTIYSRKPDAFKATYVAVKENNDG